MSCHINLKRIGIYAAGLILLAAGLTLNTKTGLGTAPVISVPLTVATILQQNFAVMTFVLYVIFVLLQFLLRKDRSWHIFLEIPFSVVFSSLLDLFSRVLNIRCTALWQQIAVLAVAIVISAVGVALSVGMQIIPNPADGMAQTIGLLTDRGTGFGKNVLDISCVVVSALLMGVTRVSAGSIGIGTLITMIGVGRVIASFNRRFGEKLAAIRQ